MQAAAEFRHHMIDGQLEPNRVLAPAIISAMGVVPREAFVPEEYQQSAYIDEPIPLDAQRFLAPPLLLGQLLQVLDIQPGQKVLVMGAGTGYAAAICHQLGCEVHMLEESQELGSRARRILSEQGMSKVEVHTGPLQLGWNAGKPFDKILVEGGVPTRPDCWFEQLAESGMLAYVQIRSMLPLAHRGRGFITTLTRQGELPVEQQHDDVASPVLPGFESKEGFEFA